MLETQTPQHKWRNATDASTAGGQIALVNIKNSAISIYWSLLHIVISVGILFTVPFWLMPLFSILPALAIEIHDPKISFKWLWYLKFALDLMTLAMLHLLN